ncbi:MAG: hypothetical protein ACI9U2_000495 [Bradymonadia bacterium]|jgi:hypothetical protein
MGHGKQFTDSPMLTSSAVIKAFRIGMVVGAIGVAASIAGWAVGDPEMKKQFFFSWLTGFTFVLTISLGALFFILIHHISRATWSAGLRRTAENVAANLPWLVIAFIPIIVGMHDLYHWSHAEAVALDPILQAKASYLDPTFFLVRAAFYFAAWTLMALWFRKQSTSQDVSGDIKLTFKMRSRAPVGILTFAITVSFASFDWMMSLDPHWFSTMFGVQVFSGAMVSFLATLGIASLWLTRDGRFENTLTVGNIHDVGKLMFGFTIFWAYVTFSQYYLIWYANIPEETAWFYLRMHNGWENVARLVIFGHFMVPFWVILSRHMKRNRTVLGLVCGWMLLMHFVDLYFLVMPTLHHGLHPHWLDLTCVLGLSGFATALFARRYLKTAGVAAKDPQLVASMEYDNG